MTDTGTGTEVASHAAASCSLYDGAQGYRISDILTSRFFRHTTGGLTYHQRTFTHSFAARFGKEYGASSKNKTLWLAYYANTTCVPSRCVRAGFCQCFVTPALAVLDMIQRDETKALQASTAAAAGGAAGAAAAAAAGSPEPRAAGSEVPRVQPHTAAVHLRVGDVIEKSPFTVDQMLAQRTRFTQNCDS